MQVLTMLYFLKFRRNKNPQPQNTGKLSLDYYHNINNFTVTYIDLMAHQMHCNKTIFLLEREDNIYENMSVVYENVK